MEKSKFVRLGREKFEELSGLARAFNSGYNNPFRKVAKFLSSRGARYNLVIESPSITLEVTPKYIMVKPKGVKEVRVGARREEYNQEQYADKIMDVLEFALQFSLFDTLEGDIKIRRNVPSPFTNYAHESHKKIVRGFTK